MFLLCKIQFFYHPSPNHPFRDITYALSLFLFLLLTLLRFIHNEDLDVSIC
ncbi:hypothetical protein RDI58_005595 [Solanum bulbocastanum]|uniref:Uncharacterized protein n=1 Tax=Solanum bulbocastanum TaxID=147425 RepID=A0AAN8YR33_SOLBU